MTKAIRKPLLGSFIQLPYPHLITLPLLLLSGQQIISPPVLATATDTQGGWKGLSI